MKHYDVDVKKFIKNVVSLVVSGLLLVAATIAWFASTHNTTVERVTVSMQADFQVSFMHHTTGSTYLDNVTSGGTTSLKVRQRDSSGAFTTDALLKTYVESLQSNTWESSDADNNDWDLVLYPGKYGLYKFEYFADSTPKNLKIQFGSLPSDIGDTMDEIEINAWAVSVTNSNGTETLTDIRQASMTMSDLNPASNTASTVFTNAISATAGTQVRVYYVIGMPATDGTAGYKHDETVQAENRTIPITQVYLDTVTGN